ncbi:ankyrin repeat protein [Colletotrichum karsti]|uniref:Ankyrin repeat protein n=1 Tax=Colletotrichum karsti TaxID=1095194 RepID=A0A9P6I275_9PEZI|nr:ankyrin repeat protein [Colletotrichum karsti]KAF9874417.1 ankyrin repeat protein [Colletotrichum karsti]
MSESPSSSQATYGAQTGRPSLWTDSAERKLARLYVYTTLPLVKIVEVVHKATPGNRDCPGKDSANKKLNAILDKEPRWLHPRTRTDMERRITALDSSPTRQTPPEDAFSPEYTSPGARSLLSVNPEFKDEGGNSPNVHEIQSYDHSRASSAGWNPGATGPLPTLMTPEYVSVAPAEPAELHRSGTMQSLGDVLSDYSSGFIRQVNKLLKRYTMPSNMMLNQSPIDEDRPGTSSSNESNAASWIFEYDAPQRVSETEARPLPGDFLSLHHRLEQQGACMPGLPEHNRRSCYCHVRDELSHESWVFGQGPSQFAEYVYAYGKPPDDNFARRDVFGNTILHLLAAGNAPHSHLYSALTRELSPNPSATNSAGQTFLHVLNDSWFTGRAELLSQLIRFLKRQQFDLYACDVYGRNFCHIIHSKDPRVVSQETKNALLALFSPLEYCRRDAFGNIPESATPGLNVRRAYTNAVGEEMSPTWNARTQRQLSSPIEQQANLLRTINEAYRKPRLQDSQGRNALHCLADAILSQESLLAKFGAPSDEQQQTSPVSRKRKHNKPVLQKALSDSSKERLTARENVVRDLIDLGVDPNHYDKYGNTVLMAFVAQLPEDDDYKKPVAILEFLIQAGANINARNRSGETALHIAVRRGKKLAMRTLTQHGANVQARDVEGRSILDVADRMVVTGRRGIDHPRYEACHAWLSGYAKAIQNPTIQQEWEFRES